MTEYYTHPTIYLFHFGLDKSPPPKYNRPSEMGKSPDVCDANDRTCAIAVVHRTCRDQFSEEKAIKLLLILIRDQAN